MISTPRLTLSLLTLEDINEVLIMFKEPNTFKYIKHMLDATPEECLAFLHKKISNINSKKGYFWTARTLDTKELIGTFNLSPIPSDPEKLQIGWQIKTVHRGQGYAYECAQAIMKYAINTLKLSIVYGVYEVENIASEKLFNKLNFSFVETKTPPNNVPINIYKYIV